MRQSIKLNYPTIFDDELTSFLIGYRKPANQNKFAIKTRNKNNWLVSPLKQAPKRAKGVQKLGGVNVVGCLACLSIFLIYANAWGWM